MTSTHTPLVLVHGWAGSARSWAPVEALIDTGLWGPIIPVRLPGSPRYAGGSPATIPAATAELVKLLSSLARPAVVVGHSMGAQVTLRAQSLASESICGEVVIDPAYGPPVTEAAAFESWASRIEHAGHDGLRDFFSEALVGVPAELAQAALSDFESTSIDVIVRYLRSEYTDPGSIGLEPAVRLAAEKRQRPVLAIHSNARAAAFERTLAAPPGSRIEEWPAFHHFLHLEDPSRFVTAVEEWMRDLLVVDRTHPVAERT